MKSPSRLERRFSLLWHSLNGPALESEFRFHPTRKWKADFAHLPSRTLIEIEGGIWICGRHTTPRGFAADAEKYLEAALGGWRVVRLVDAQLVSETLRRVIAAIRCQWEPIR